MGNERSFAEVGVSTGPFDGALGRVLATSDPGTKLDLHRSLRESSTRLSVSVLQFTDLVAVDRPDNMVLGPLQRVGVNLALGVGNRVVGTTIVGSRIALAEVVGLHLGRVATNPLPINLVQIVGLQYETRDYSSTGCGLNLHVNLAEEDVLGAGDSRSIGLLVDCEHGAGAIVLNRGAIGGLEEVVLPLGEVNGNGASQSRVSRASWRGMLANWTIGLKDGISD